MSIAKECRSKIKSVASTQKVTGAMEKLAASKMKKAQLRMQASYPYSQKIRDVIANLSRSQMDYPPIWAHERDIRRVAYFVVSSDRGLCGGLNANIFRLLMSEYRSWKERGVEVYWVVVGRKAEAFFRRYGGHVLGRAEQIGDRPTLESLLGVMKVGLDAFTEHKIDALFMAHNRFINTMTQKPQITPLLPLSPSFLSSKEQETSLKGGWDYIYEPSASQLLEVLIMRYLESQMYHSVVENMACEQAARMVAMKNATENAGNLIHELKLMYNKARQAAITKELSEIVSGADAVGS